MSAVKEQPMAKRQRRSQKKRETVAQPAPKPRSPQASYVPPPCSACASLRPNEDNYTRVYSTTNTTNATTRYCRCGFCGNTFKDVTMRMVSSS